MRPAGVLLLILAIGATLGLGMALGRATQPLSPGPVYGWALASAVFGCLWGSPRSSPAIATNH
jgi:hypothetical protein